MRSRFLTSLLVLVACSPDLAPEPATQILLRIECEEPVCERAAHVRVRAVALGGDSHTPTEMRELDIALQPASTWPVDIPLLPRDPRSLPEVFQVSLQARDVSDAVLADARAITFFERASERLLRMRLGPCGDDKGACEPDQSCVGEHCRTCNGRSCELTPIIDPKTLPELNATSLPATPRMPSTRGDASTFVPSPGAAMMTPPGTADTGVAAADGGSEPAPSRRDAGIPTDAATPTDAAVHDADTTLPLPAWSTPEALEGLSAGVQLPAFAHNRAGSLALAWWQESRDGDLWLRRYHAGAWDPEPLSVRGAQRPSTFMVPPSLGIDAATRAYVLAPVGGMSASNGSMLWLRWSGGASSERELPWLMGRAAVVSVPTMLSVAEDGRAASTFASPPQAQAGTAQLFVSTYEMDTWGAPERSGSVDYAPVDGAVSASNARGDYVSVFRVKRSQADEAVRALSLIAGRIGSPARASLVELPAALVGPVRVVIDEAGDASLLFAIEPAESPRVYGLYYARDSQAWSTLVRVATPAVNAYALSLLPTGEPIAVLREDTQVVLTRYDRAQGWSGPQPVGVVSLPEADGGVELAVAGSGDMLVTWVERGADGARELFALRASSTGTFGAPSRVTRVNGTIELVAAAWSDMQQPLVVWLEAESNVGERSLMWSRSE